MSYCVYLIDLADKLTDLIADQSTWSQKTFGTDQERGPLGALKHLEKEAREAQDKPNDGLEYADCFLLILDASRRAGIPIMKLLDLAKEKMKINKERKWGSANGNEPVEHIRNDE